MNGKRVIVGKLGEQVEFLTTCTRGAESSDVKLTRGARAVAASNDLSKRVPNVKNHVVTGYIWVRPRSVWLCLGGA